MRERTVADRGTRYRRKPPVKHGELERERGKHWEVALLEVVHDLLRMPDVFLLMKIAGYEPLHICSSSRSCRPTKNLHIDCRKMMVGIGIELPLKLGKRLRFHRSVIGIRIRESVRVDIPVDRRIHGLQ